jgi:hypothetical protein
MVVTLGVCTPLSPPECLIRPLFSGPAKTRHRVLMRISTRCAIKPMATAPTEGVTWGP